jgi:rhodanese-related sulfurtransferase
MQEVNLFKFVSENILLIAVAFVSGGMLIWPAVRRSTAGPSISTLQATLLINQKNAVVLDVRDATEYASGHVISSRNIPLGELDARAAELEKYKAKPVIVICDTGNRSGKAAAALRRLGVKEVFNLSGGIGAWRQSGLPLEK